LALEAQAVAKNSEEIVPGENSGKPLAVIPFKIQASEVLAMVKSLRAAGQEVVVELKSRGLGKSLSWADAVGASHALIIGPKDLESGTCNVKDLQSGQQVECALDAESIIVSL
jgi:histidyl-tRNA synthetase